MQQYPELIHFATVFVTGVVFALVVIAFIYWCESHDYRKSKRAQRRLHKEWREQQKNNPTREW